MKRYTVELQTCKQHLNSEKGAVLHVFAENKQEAEFKAMDICEILESDMDEMSVYRIYSISVKVS